MLIVQIDGPESLIQHQYTIKEDVSNEYARLYTSKNKDLAYSILEYTIDILHG